MSVAAETCQVKPMATLPMMVMGNSSTFVVPVTIANRPLRMLFDTGAAITILEGQVALQLGIHLAAHPTAHLAGIGGEADAWEMMSLPVMLDRSNTYPSALITDPAKPLYQGAFDGILGADAFFFADFEVDPQSKRVNLFREYCPGQVVYWANEYSTIPFKRGEQNQLEIQVNLNGRKLRGIIDTGNSHTSMSWKAAGEIFDLTPASAGVSANGKTLTADGRSLDVAQYTFDTLELGDLKIRHAIVDLLPQYSTNVLTDVFGLNDWSPQIIIGMDLLRHLRFYVANKDRMIYFTVVPPSDTAPTSPS